MSYNSIPSREPLGIDGWGPGISDDLTTLKARDLLDEDEFAVMGFVVLPSSYDDDNPLYEEGDKKPEYAKVEIMLPSEERFAFNTSSRSLMQHLKRRWDNNRSEDNPTGDIPFKTSLQRVPNKSGKYSYYKFT